MTLSLKDSFPVLSGFVQYTPLAFVPLIESGSFGIWFRHIAPKLLIPPASSYYLIFKTCVKAC